MPQESVDCVVIGAGVLGLAVARALALAGREVIVLETAATIGTETSSRNSEVIHAGIYYPHGSLKALTCVAGKQALYNYCNDHHVPHRRCGKLIVATDKDHIPALDELRRKAVANGVHDLELLDASKVRELEPEVRCAAAVWSPSTGIVDSHALMLAYQGDAECAGAVIAFLSPAIGGMVTDRGLVVDVGGNEPMRLTARSLVNSAGLHACRVATTIKGLPRSTIPRLYYAKGNYYTLTTRSPFRRLIYPLPEKCTTGLGIHATLDMAGRTRFGPDVEWIEDIDYRVNTEKSRVFAHAIRGYWPSLPAGVLQPGYAGIRPKLQARGGPAADFMIQGPDAHGVPGLVNLYGIESPGLTASLAIATRVTAALTV
ncbi:MAG: NAD(P)/FAD-dependent oxidoreductase [Gammaproteobacteria bacterium]|nr:NAD(P)/FAD-dependent oxidoreductase [Gammaproteobacteria bacterium]